MCREGTGRALRPRSADASVAAGRVHAVSTSIQTLVSTTNQVRRAGGSESARSPSQARARGVEKPRRPRRRRAPEGVIDGLALVVSPVSGAPPPPTSPHPSISMFVRAHQEHRPCVWRSSAASCLLVLDRVRIEIARPRRPFGLVVEEPQAGESRTQPRRAEAGRTPARTRGNRAQRGSC